MSCSLFVISRRGSPKCRYDQVEGAPRADGGAEQLSTASVAGETAGKGVVRHEIEDHPAEPFPSMDGNAGIGYL